MGLVSGFKDNAIRARVEGYPEGVHFEEGSRVEKDSLLYALESQPFEAAVSAQMSMVAEAKAVSESDLDSAVAL